MNGLFTNRTEESRWTSERNSSINVDESVHLVGDALYQTIFFPHICSFTVDNFLFSEYLVYPVIVIIAVIVVTIFCEIFGGLHRKLLTSQWQHQTSDNHFLDFDQRAKWSWRRKKMNKIYVDPHNTKRRYCCNRLLWLLFLYLL